MYISIFFSFYKWENSFFSQKSREFIDPPVESELYIYNEANSEPLVLSIGNGNITRVVALKLELKNNRWTKLQSLHFKQNNIQHYIVKDQLYLIGCSTDLFCGIYKWNNKQFRRRLKINSQFFEATKEIHFQRDVVILESFEKKLSLYLDDDVINPQPSAVFTESVTGNYAIFSSPILHQLFLVDFALQNTTLGIRFYRLSFRNVKGMERSSPTTNEDPQECIRELKLKLKSRMPDIQGLQNMVRAGRCSNSALNLIFSKFTGLSAEAARKDSQHGQENFHQSPTHSTRKL